MTHLPHWSYLVGRRPDGKQRAVASDTDDRLCVSTASPAQGPLQRFHRVANAGLNAVVVAAAPGELWNLAVTNATTTGLIYVKFYAQTTPPNPATDTPAATYGVAQGATQWLSLSRPSPFAPGLAMLITKGVADNDATAVGNGDCVVDVGYTLALAP